MEDDLQIQARHLGERLVARGLRCTTAESCTGGWVAKVITGNDGSSQWFERGFVTYSNESKQEMLGVEREILDSAGAVSEAVVKEMVRGALNNSHADLALSISGIAGPEGGTPDKPVGTVWLGWGRKDEEILARRERFDGDRDAVRRQAVRAALKGMLELVN